MSDDEKEEVVAKRLMKALRRVMAPYGTESGLTGGDFWVDDAYPGNHRIGCMINDKIAFRDEIIAKVQTLVRRWKDWTIELVFLDGEEAEVRCRVDHREVRELVVHP